MQYVLKETALFVLTIMFIVTEQNWTSSATLRLNFFIRDYLVFGLYPLSNIPKNWVFQKLDWFPSLSGKEGVTCCVGSIGITGLMTEVTCNGSNRAGAPSPTFHPEGRNMFNI